MRCFHSPPKERAGEEASQIAREPCDWSWGEVADLAEGREAMKATELEPPELQVGSHQQDLAASSQQRPSRWAQ